MTGCLQRICCFLKKPEENEDIRPDIFVMTQIDKESIPDSDSGVHSNANKLGKLGLNGSVSEEDSGVGSEGKESDIADQTDTSSHVDTDSLKPAQSQLRRNASQCSKENFSDFELPLENTEADLTAEIALQLKQMNGFSLEGNNTKTILESCQPVTNEADKKKKRKRRKQRKVAAAQSNTSQETSEDGAAEEVKEV